MKKIIKLTLYSLILLSIGCSSGQHKYKQVDYYKALYSQKYDDDPEDADHKIYRDLQVRGFVRLNEPTQKECFSSLLKTNGVSKHLFVIIRSYEEMLTDHGSRHDPDVYKAQKLVSDMRDEIHDIAVYSQKIKDPNCISFLYGM
jgi:hypothetical protein